MELYIEYKIPPVNFIEVEKNFMKKLSEVFVQNIKQKTPVVTGNLQKSVKSIVKDNDTIIVSSDIKYSRMVEFGTGIYKVDYVKNSKGETVSVRHKPWDIYPKKAKALHWKDKSGKDHFATHVHQIGFEGRHMFRDGMMASLPQIRKIMSEAFNNAKRK